MRRPVIAVVVSAALLLAGCGSSDKDAAAAPAPSASAPAPAPTAAPTGIPAADAKSKSIDDVSVTGKPDAKPTVKFAAPLVAPDGGSKVLSTGKGAKVEDGQQVTAHMTLVSGNDGKVLQSSYDAKTPANFPVDKTQITPPLYEAIVGKPLGSRVELLINGAAAQGDAPQTLVYIIDLVSAKKVPTRAEGNAVPPVAGLPTVTLAGDGAPTITVPKSAAPTALKVQPLIQGAGPKVVAGQSVTVKYTGVTWADGKVFDTSWKAGAQPFVVSPVGQAQVIAGWNESLIGQNVGSQILVIIPPDKGYGAQANGSIPANSTLVFVIDILDAA